MALTSNTHAPAVHLFDVTQAHKIHSTYSSAKHVFPPLHYNDCKIDSEYSNAIYLPRHERSCPTSEVLKAIKINVMVFREVTPCRLVDSTNVPKEIPASIFVNE